MAGDWLKIETDTPEKPEVLGIASKLGLDPDAVLGKLFRVWRWFDRHTTDGNAHSVTVLFVDAHTGVTGFAEAMQSVGWLVVHDDGLSLPNFDRHNGKTSKQRALTAKRVLQHRMGRDGKCNGASVTNVTLAALAREEKSNISSSPSHPPKPKATAKRSQEKKSPRKRDDLFDAVVKATDSDPNVNASHVAKVSTLLKQADPPYTPAEVLRLPEILAARGFTLPLSVGTVEKYIGWARKQPKPAGGVGAEQERQKKAREQREHLERMDQEAAASRAEAQETLRRNIRHGHGRHDDAGHPDANGTGEGPAGLNAQVQ